MSTSCSTARPLTSSLTCESLSDGRGFPTDVAERALDNSLHVVSLRQANRLVGFGRITGDAAMRFYVEDVAVLPYLQGRALGRLIMDELVARLDENVPSCGKTYLMAADGSVRFYEHFGFERRADSEPGMWRAPRREP
jgi:ribosomal protein S18 acetylase RimI-like enzyme